MKRSLESTDSLGALVSATAEDKQHVYSGCVMLEGLNQEDVYGGEESGAGGYIGEKKRRLSVDQVKALEKNFEVENKLEPERKVKLAQELGLQPRQVAVWFQNRRARWKTKQLERDYGVLKANYDALKLNYDSLHRDNEALLKQIKELKAELNEDASAAAGGSNLSVKEEEMVLPESDDDDKLTEGEEDGSQAGAEMVPDSNEDEEEAPALLFTEFNKDGSSDSDSSAVLNEENYYYSPMNPSAMTSSSSSSIGVLQNQTLVIPSRPAVTANTFHQLSAKSYQTQQQQQLVKLEEYNFLGSEEEAACNFFSDEQAPSLHWYCPTAADPWN